jgi:asparagine synthase (glutamine-hydrolysing)
MRKDEFLMCGIVGLFGFQDERLLKSMLEAVKHRGPDDEGTFSDGLASLGFRRLSIVDVDRGHQPMHNEDETVWIVFNGEIYNYQEIRDELVRLGHRFDSWTDTETVVHAYEEWGVECLRKLNGMFAVAVWDKNKRRLFIARDRLGVKPLYYYGTNERLLFASEIKALLVDPSVQRRPNDRVISNFLLTGFQSYVGDTFFEDIKELPPAHYMLVDQEQISLERYWNLTISEPEEPEADEYYASEFRELLLDTVRIRLPKRLAIGSFLSGGLDSTSIVCLANDILNPGSQGEDTEHGSQRLFSASYQEAVADERPFIEEVSRYVGTRVDYVFPSATMGLDDVRAFVYYMDEPVTVLNYYAYWCLARATKDQVKVTFSGQGPDEILAGHADHFQTYLRQLWRKRRIGTLLAELGASLNRYGPVSVMRQMVEAMRTREESVEGLLNPEFLASHEKDRIRPERDSLNAALLMDVTRDRLPMHLRVGDRVASAFSTETRCPYLDHRIVEFCFSLPEAQKIKNAWSKYVLRNAVKGVVPESVRRRKKAGTPIPFDRWMRGLHQDIGQVFSSPKFRDRVYFNPEKVIVVWDRYCRGKMSRSERRFYGDVLWRILNVELWLEAFFDQPHGTISL